MSGARWSPRTPTAFSPSMAMPSAAEDRKTEELQLRAALHHPLYPAASTPPSNTHAMWQALPTSSAAAACWYSALGDLMAVTAAPMKSVWPSPITRPTLDAVPGDLSLCMPKRQLDNIVETLYASGQGRHPALPTTTPCSTASNASTIPPVRSAKTFVLHGTREIYAIGDGAGIHPFSFPGCRQRPVCSGSDPCRPLTFPRNTAKCPGHGNPGIFCSEFCCYRFQPFLYTSSSSGLRSRGRPSSAG